MRRRVVAEKGKASPTPAAAGGAKTAGKMAREESRERKERRGVRPGVKEAAVEIAKIAGQGQKVGEICYQDGLSTIFGNCKKGEGEKYLLGLWP